MVPLAGALAAGLAELAAAGRLRTRHEVEGRAPGGVRVRVGGEELLAFCSNDYLALADVDAMGLDTGWEESDQTCISSLHFVVSVPITDKWRFGFAGDGVSGLGVDYRHEFDLNPMTPNDCHVYTDLSIMKIAHEPRLYGNTQFLNRSFFAY